DHRTRRSRAGGHPEEEQLPPREVPPPPSPARVQARPDGDRAQAPRRRLSHAPHRHRLHRTRCRLPRSHRRTPHDPQARPTPGAPGLPRPAHAKRRLTEVPAIERIFMAERPIPDVRPHFRRLRNKSGARRSEGPNSRKLTESPSLNSPGIRWDLCSDGAPQTAPQYHSSTPGRGPRGDEGSARPSLLAWHPHSSVRCEGGEVRTGRALTASSAPERPQGVPLRLRGTLMEYSTTSRSLTLLVPLVPSVPPRSVDLHPSHPPAALHRR